MPASLAVLHDIERLKLNPKIAHKIDKSGHLAVPAKPAEVAVVAVKEDLIKNALVSYVPILETLKSKKHSEPQHAVDNASECHVVTQATVANDDRLEADGSKPAEKKRVRKKSESVD